MKEDFLQSDHLTGLWIDAFVKDDDDHLVFLSAWGSETAIQNCRARLSLPVSEGGLTRLSTSTRGTVSLERRVRVEQPERYEQLTGRPSGQSRFLHLTHLWMFPRLALQPDSANCIGVVIETSGGNAGQLGKLGSGKWCKPFAPCRCIRHGVV